MCALAQNARIISAAKIHFWVLICFTMIFSEIAKAPIKLYNNVNAVSLAWAHR